MVHYWRLAASRLLWFSVLPGAISLLVTLQGWLLTSDFGAFLEHAHETEARILRVDGTGGNLRLFLLYADAQGRRIEAVLPATEAASRDWRAAGRVGLLVDSRSPGFAEPGTKRGAANRMLAYRGVLVLGFLLLAGSMWVAINEWRRNRSRLRLFTSGALVETEVRDNVLAPNANHGCISFAYKGPDGRWYDGRSPDLPARMLAEWPKGRDLLVAYDPANPRTCEPDLFGVTVTLGRQSPAGQPRAAS